MHAEPFGSWIIPRTSRNKTIITGGLFQERVEHHGIQLRGQEKSDAQSQVGWGASVMEGPEHRQRGQESTADVKWEIPNTKEGVKIPREVFVELAALTSRGSK